MKTIALQLTHAGAAPPPGIEIDGERIAAGLGLPVATFRQLMDDRKVSVLCERGIDEDAGLYRATFHHGARRFRAVVDSRGRIVSWEC